MKKKEKDCPLTSSLTNSQYDQFLKDAANALLEIPSPKKSNDAINKAIEEGLKRPPNEI